MNVKRRPVWMWRETNEKDNQSGLLQTSANTSEDHFRAVRALLHNGEEGLKEIEIYD